MLITVHPDLFLGHFCYFPFIQVGRESRAWSKNDYVHLAEQLAIELELGVLCAVGLPLWHAAWAFGTSQGLS